MYDTNVVAAALDCKRGHQQLTPRVKCLYQHLKSVHPHKRNGRMLPARGGLPSNLLMRAGCPTRDRGLPCPLLLGCPARGGLPCNILERAGCPARGGLPFPLSLPQRSDVGASMRRSIKILHTALQNNTVSEFLASPCLTSL